MPPGLEEEAPPRDVPPSPSPCLVPIPVPVPFRVLVLSYALSMCSSSAVHVPMKLVPSVEFHPTLLRTICCVQLTVDFWRLFVFSPTQFLHFRRSYFDFEHCCGGAVWVLLGYYLIPRTQMGLKQSATANKVSDRATTNT